MQKIFALALLMCSCSSLAHSEDDQPGADMPKDCVAKAMEIGQETDSEFKRMSHTVIAFQPPLRGTNLLTVDCGPGSAIGGPGISLYWQTAFPPAAYYELLAKAGAVLTGESQSALLAATKSCAKQALAEETEMADQLTAKAKIECHAFVRNGGSVGTFIYLRDKDD
ncbi:hypothetical protein [Hyphomicrobium facile]|uniref:Uncharacterized protein n=1 Tax=Hyphomicrobium facile TaxID=51670 RepID=A0A1I7NWY9_9HYPH|nr:hypothetical protein [Hyphomicrobium facile]SFV39108.1 hypothetical protein SAMN04488557_4133 [Hyphomicrobium facile]